MLPPSDAVLLPCARHTYNESILIGAWASRTPGRDPPAVIAVDVVPDNSAGAGPSGRALSGYYPRYTYDEPPIGEQASLIQDEQLQHDNITDDALGAYRAHYGEWVTKDHIFAYVYGITALAGLP